MKYMHILVIAAIDILAFAGSLQRFKKQNAQNYSSLVVLGLPLSCYLEYLVESEHSFFFSTSSPTKLCGTRNNTSIPCRTLAAQPGREGFADCRGVHHAATGIHANSGGVGPKRLFGTIHVFG
jgi:hypothetical protein